MQYIIDDKEYITIKEFSRLTNRTTSSSRYLILDGNKIRKLKAVLIDSTYFIEKDELYKFPFTDKGRYAQSVYHYDKDLNLKLCTACSEGLICPLHEKYVEED